jgi:methyl coenzyme M reductase subunit D
VQHKHAQPKREDKQRHENRERQHVQDDVLDHLHEAGQLWITLKVEDAAG